jgi:hypothetical protein
VAGEVEDAQEPAVVAPGPVVVAPVPEAPGGVGKFVQAFGPLLVVGDKEIAAEAFDGGQVLLRVKVVDARCPAAQAFG